MTKAEVQQAKDDYKKENVTNRAQVVDCRTKSNSDLKFPSNLVFDGNRFKKKPDEVKKLVREKGIKLEEDIILVGGIHVYPVFLALMSI